MATCLDVILIGGAAFVGTSHLAQRLAERLGWDTTSTDTIGRHPGMPWDGATEAVAELYGTVSAETLHWLLRIHHQNIWPAIEVRLAEARISGRPLILEGDALRPEHMQGQVMPGTEVVCLTASEAALRDRIWSASRHTEADSALRRQIRAYLDRTLLDNQTMVDMARRHGVPVIDSGDTAAVDQWLARVAAAAGH